MGRAIIHYRRQTRTPEVLLGTNYVEMATRETKNDYKGSKGKGFGTERIGDKF